MHTVLLVDDEIFARKGLRNLIRWEDCGYEVIEEADNGEDALELIHRIQPDLVITDIRMPVLDGLELIRRSQEEMERKPKFIIISGYDDFAYAQQGLRYGVFDFLLKPIDEDELRETLRNLDRRISQDKLFRMKSQHLLDSASMDALLKGEAGAQDIAHWAKRYGISADSVFRYILIEVNDWTPWQLKANPFTYDDVVRQIKLSVSNCLEKGRGIYVHQHRNRWGLLLPVEWMDQSGQSLERFLKELRQRLERGMAQPVYLYAGKSVGSLAEVSQSYRSAREALQHKYAENADRLVIFERIKEKSLNHVHMDFSVYQRLTEKMEEMSKAEVNAAIEEMFREFEEKRYAPEAVKLSIHQCVSAVLKIIREMEGDEDDMTQLEPIISWQDMNLTLQEIKRLFTNWTEESMQVISNRRRETGRGGIQKIKSYIETNYQENMSLKSIAAQFYMNPVYLGQLFRKTYGVYFNEFLLQIRVAEAKKLLRQTDLRIYEIAEKIGFNNADYFVTQFEKLEKCSPSEYRSKLK
ncbi:response regulator [Gorillibacterium massiliense]|uniref:response regulator n=1 Tax=Gorillibacterium massiliense TaxID=1280390 RepID=UPI0004ADCD62|nr:response regulator [Gorillibacterium massiliense]